MNYEIPVRLYDETPGLDGLAQKLAAHPRKNEAHRRARREVVAELTRLGWTVRQIANYLRCTEQTVQTDRRIGRAS